MRIIFSKTGGAGDAAVLTCIRDDGTSTFSKSRDGGFFGPHDLMHYAVESTLGLTGSFFGLIARGWTVASFAEPGASRRLPPEALHTEMMVGQLMQEHAYGPPLDAKAFNAVITESLRSTARLGGEPLPSVRQVTDGDLRRIREVFADLLGRYTALRDGERLELDFPSG